MKPAIGTLARFTSEQLKAEMKRRRAVENAKKFLPSAEAAVARAQARVDRYRALISANVDMLASEKAGES